MFASTTTPLTANNSVTIGPYETFRAQKITGTVFADQAGTLIIEQSFDNQNWDSQTTINVSANTPQTIDQDVVGTYFRAVYTNGGTNQGAFRLFIRAFQSGAT